MRPEQFQDAMTLLPEDLLEPVDALRRKKRFPWKSVLATAACFCLVLGLALGYAKLVGPASMENGAAPNRAEDAEEAPEMLNGTVSHSTSELPSLVEVVQVEADHVFVVSNASSNSDSCALRAPIRLTFEKLEEVPTLEVGQTILIYWHTEDYDAAAHSIAPYQIEIQEE